MNHKCFSILITLFLLLPIWMLAQAEEFYGPFPSWTNLKKAYGAKGDGKTDDTRAIQKALDELGEKGKSPVLFIPNGIYRITATLTMKTKKGIAIFGEDPLQTIISWDGKEGEKMFYLNGVSYSEYGRITWDGNNKAAAAYAHIWDQKVQFANSGSQHSDEVFRNIGVGLISGRNMDAEISIRRCRFYNCSVAGISLQGANALDWWIWDCYFENCYTGVTNFVPENGAGNFHVYRSIFNRSVNSDILIGNSNFFSFRDNISFNSTRFLRAMQYSNTSPITIQNNLIITNKVRTPVELFTKGNLLLLNNTFISPDTGQNFIISNMNNYKNTYPDITLIGNRFTAKNKIFETNSQRLFISDEQRGIRQPAIPPIKPYDFAPRVNYPVIEITDTISTTNLQAIINKAAATKRKTVLHFSYGHYPLTKSLQIPPASLLILTGDGLRSVLSSSAKDTTGNAIIKFAAPARSVIKSLWIQGNNKTDGIVVSDKDGIGNRIYSNQLLLFNGVESNLNINGFSNTSFRFENFQHNYCVNGTSVIMKGGGKTNNSTLRIFGGETAAHKNTYEVKNGGKILIYDTWFEGNTDQFMTLKGKGEFYLNGAKIAATNNKPGAFITIDSFSGKVVIAQAIYNSPGKKIVYRNHGSNSNFLTLGTLSWNDSTSNIYQLNAPASAYLMYNNRYNVGKGSIPLPNMGDTSAVFLKRMLQPILQTSVKKDPAPAKQATQLVLDRVMIDGSKINLRIEKGN